MTHVLQQDYFSLFGLPVSYDINTEALGARYLALQQQFHPDKFASHSAQEQLLAAQMTAQINEAQRVLKDTVLRADYLLSLQGNTESLEDNTIADGTFLMAQMRLREQLEAANNEAEIEAVAQAAETQQVDLASEFAAVYAKDIQTGFALVQKMKFFQRLAEQAEDKLEAL